KGYAFTIQAVAARAKVGKQTIYRWWPTKPDLLADCLLEGLMWGQDLSPRDTGDVHADMLEWLTRLLGVGGDGTEARLLRSFITAASSDDELAARLRSLLNSSGQVTLRLEKAVVEGELPAYSTVQQIEDALVGLIVLAAVGWADATPEGLARAVAHAVASAEPVAGEPEASEAPATV
ncbi:MAG: TetR-like C-terminal domain-containing protein, partial [Nocardioides sp.]|uniref:TetR-like C-terminal domain-containing protein n=1 Tax=Nocardioides sp. TaxID=35761 RepID=UPI003F116672